MWERLLLKGLIWLFRRAWKRYYVLTLEHVTSCSLEKMYQILTLFMFSSNKTHLKTSSLSSLQLCPLHTELLGEYAYHYRFPWCFWLRSQQQIHVTLAFFFLSEGSETHFILHNSAPSCFTLSKQILHLQNQMHGRFTLWLVPSLNTHK